MSQVLAGIFLVTWADTSTSWRFSNSNPDSRLIELYTSQGCHSCPPAEAWLGDFEENLALWKTMFPVAMHVTYWDNLGWKDPFSDQQYTDRQQDFKNKSLLKSVYTPCFIVNGWEWRGWHEGKSLPRREASRGTLSGELRGTRLSVSYTGHGYGEDVSFDLYISVLGMDHKTEVKGGENSGKLLKETFISLHLGRNPSDSATWKVELPSGLNSNQALVLWVTKKDWVIPLQVAGGVPGK